MVVSGGGGAWVLGREKGGREIERGEGGDTFVVRRGWILALITVAEEPRYWFVEDVFESPFYSLEAFLAGDHAWEAEVELYT